MKKSVLLLILSYLLTVFAVLTLLLRFFYPAHRIVAISLYLISWIPFIYSFIVFKKFEKFIHKHKKQIKIFKNHKRLIINLIIMILIGYFLYVIFPVEDTNYFNMHKEDLNLLIQEDFKAYDAYSKGFESTMLLIESNKHLFEKDLKDITLEDKELIISIWSSYIAYSVKLDEIVERNKYFYQISYLDEPVLNLNSFLIGYSAYLTNYENGLRLKKVVGDREYIEIILNEKRDSLNIEKDMYFNLKYRLTHADELIRLNAGYGNLLFLESTNHIQSELIDIAKIRYKSIYDLLGEEPELFVDNPLDYFEKNTFEKWFPAQKSIAEGIGHVKIELRDRYITNEDLNILNKEMIPGDILLQRREWQLTNVGIPGFWTHAALYIGNYDEFINYFSDIKNKEEIDLDLKNSNSNFFTQYNNLNSNNESYRVIEALSDGVILHSLEDSAMADFLGVVRPNLNKLELYNSLIRGIKYYESPYDYNFDFVTDNEVVCSELIYKTYFNNESGINFDLELTSGRYMLSPNNIIKKFDEEFDNKDKDLLFVAFLNKINEKDLIEFAKEHELRYSWKRTE